MKTRKPAAVFPPGEYIREELDARGWTAGDLAQVMGRPPLSVNQIIKGKRGITPDIAVALSAAFGTSAEFWMNLQTIYSLSETDADVKAIQRRVKELSSRVRNRQQLSSM